MTQMPETEGLPAAVGRPGPRHVLAAAPGKNTRLPARVKEASQAAYGRTLCRCSTAALNSIRSRLRSRSSAARKGFSLGSESASSAEARRPRLLLPGGGPPVMESAALRERGDGWDYRSASRFKVTLSHPLEQGDRQECGQRVEAGHENEHRGPTPGLLP
jgi:hypothetical protein